jgi:uncharacterized protein (TIGR03643 family)
LGISKTLKQKIDSLSEDDKDRLVRMGWEDRTTFDGIEHQFGLTQNEFIRFMRTQLDDKAYRRWRRRANTQGHLKHQKTRGFKTTRFKSTRQTVDGLTKGWKPRK